MELLKHVLKPPCFALLVLICASKSVFCSGNFEHVSSCVVNNTEQCSSAGCRSLNFVCGEIDNEYKLMSYSYLDCAGGGTERYYYGTVGFKNCEFKKFEKNYYEKFKYLHTLNITNVQLETLQIKSFSGANALKTFIARSNHLMEIPAHLFVHAEKIVFVDFSNNSINRIDLLAFDGSNFLHTVNLSRNFISHLDSHSLAVPSLSVLDLSYNNLSHLNEDVFGSDLKQLNLSYNPIGNLKINTFAYLPNLEHLRLRHTNISSIQLGTFSYQHKLISLDLSQNNLKELDFNLFLPILHDLRSLYLSENQLTELKDFQNAIFPELTLLDMKNNRFNCSYLQQFMKNINWDKLHLHIDPNAISPQKTNIRGVYCESVIMTKSNDVGNRNESQSSNVDGDSRITHFYQNKSSQNSVHGQIVRRTEQQFYADIFIIKVVLIFNCLIMFLFLVFYLILNRNRFYCQKVVFDRQTSSQNVEFSNTNLL